MNKRPLVLAFLIAALAAAAALLLRALRLLRAPRTESDIRGLSAGSAVSDVSPSARPGDGEPRSENGEQTEESGAGDLLHRRYELEVPSHAMDRQTLLHAMQRNMSELSPSSLAEFEKTVGSEQRMEIGDEYDITMLGPWNGRVRVCKVTEESFTLVTLQGHPEAGHITFSVVDADDAPQSLRVRIDSWARARDNTVKVAYDSLGIGKQVQTEVWVTFLQRVAAMAGAAEAGEPIDVRVTTERHEDDAAPRGAAHA